MNNGSKDSIVALGGVGILAYDMNNDEQQWGIYEMEHLACQPFTLIKIHTSHEQGCQIKGIPLGSIKTKVDLSVFRSPVKKRRSRRKTIWRSVAFAFVSRISPIKISKFKNSGVQKAIERRFRMRSLI